MSTTKQKILATSLVLFNQYGLSKITLRSIAKEIGMSQGNLSYHYKKREDIIEALYHQLVLKIDEKIQATTPSSVTVKTLYDIARTTITLFYEYRFFFLDFTQIMREHENIRIHYNQLMTLRKKQTLDLFEILIKQELIRPEKIANEYDHLYTRIQIISDFWMTSKSLEHASISLKTTEDYIKIISESIYPYLTQKGIKEYQKIQ
ncbi:TetR/AcrR family transcriptional regulator [Wenyingzhuangia aestuarii]|uniref:TetR/AcrR family transcriptional regulator n=1 Tax=Wenyingzhuangia aestuarii TaxID=1647582 RepID=UPI00143AB2CC|nr:TetR/AcrR family transcriptional regulator [Wenyingzhuangia aestuarii]NJB82336.1 AcrR family transcriptional regulator [Wenyingzhuangia aestuarii]